MDSDCSSKQRDNYLSFFTPKTPHFFKIILEDTIRDGKLGIPRKFLTKYGNGLSSPVLLRVPSGSTWQVELTKSVSDVWLQDGWQRFVEHYSLKHGHLLVFKYEGHSNFQVIIFDMSASEIEYPFLGHSEDHKSDEECQEPKKEEAKSVNSDEISHETPPKKSRERSGSARSHPRKKRRTITDKNKRDCGDVSNGEGDLQTRVPRETQAFGAKEYDKALQRACAFTSKNPYFLVTMQPSYINPGRKMCIPRSFTTKFLKEQLGDITLTLDGKTWSANYWRYISVNKYTKAILYNGWREFMLDNKLEVGDVCVFELIKQTEILLNVVIFRVGEDSNCCSSMVGIISLADGDIGSLSTQRTGPLTSHEKARAILRASDFKSKNPFFKVVMQPAYLKTRCSVNIPYKFVKKYLDEKKDQVILQVDGRTWIVKFSVDVMGSGQHKAKFHQTWKGFARDNNLEVGDVCVFELINRKETSFKVSIFSAAPDANFSLSPQADDTRASQTASKKCVIPKFEADDYFGNCNVGISSHAAQSTCLEYQATEADDTRANQAASKKCLIPKVEADDDFGNRNVGITSRAAQSTSLGDQATQADDTIASQAASKKCLIPKVEADDDFGNYNAGISSRAAQSTSLGYQATEADDTRASQAASKKFLIPKLEADDDFGNSIVGISSRAAQSTSLGYQATEADDTRASQAASKKFLIPKLEADDDFGYSIVGISSRAAQSTNLGYQATEADDTRASQAASKKFLIPKLEADDGFGNSIVGISSRAAQSTSLGHQATEGALPANPQPNDTKLRGIKLENPEKNYTLHPSMQGYGASSTKPRSPHTEGIWRRQPLPAYTRNKALQRAKAFESQSPFFIVAMQRSYIHTGHRLAIPLDFSRNHMTERVKDIILCMPTGKTWRAKCHREANETNPRAKLIDGWRTFAEDNNLEVGDVCVFEMIESKGYELSFNVVIYQAEEDERKLW